MIDISQYRLLTPANSKLVIDNEITVHYRNGNIETYNKDSNIDIDLTLVAGTTSEDFNLVFYNRTQEFIKNCQKSEDWLQALYYMFDFTVNANWVECTQHNELEFLDAMYFNEGDDQPEVEEASIIV